jgi:hypothetical protein
MTTAETRAKPARAASRAEPLPAARLPLPPRRRRPRRTIARSFVAALLLACAAALVLVILDEIDGTPAATADAAAAPPSAPQSAPMATLKPLTAYAETVARPLFSPLRRAPVPAPPAAAPGQISGLVLTGIVGTEHDHRALVQRGRPGPTLRVAVGQEIEGWTVRAIGRDRIVLQHGSTEHELRLRDKEPGPGRP